MAIENSTCDVLISRFDAHTGQKLIINAVSIRGDIQFDSDGSPTTNPFLPVGVDEGDGKGYSQYKLYLEPISGYFPRIGDYFEITEDEGVMSGTYRMNKANERMTGGGLSYLRIPLINISEA